MKKEIIFYLIYILFYVNVNGQGSNFYEFNNLSSIYYSSKIDSLKKGVKPAVIFSKETQKVYEEQVNSRVEAIVQSLKVNQFVYQPEIYNYINSILLELVSRNKELIPNMPFLLLDRSASVNAYTFGFNILAVNMGMIDFARSKEELSFVLAHELSHNLLNHAQEADMNRADWLTSDEYKNGLKDISASKYQKFSKLKNLVKGFSFTRNRHSRYGETNADSLAIVLLKNAKIPFNAQWLLRLDSADNNYQLSLKKDIASYFTEFDISINVALTQKKALGLSSKVFNFKDTTKLQDSLKTHPDCEIRYNAILAQNSPAFNETKIPEAIKAIAKKVYLWNLFDDGHLTACSYRIILEKDNGNTDPWYNYLFNNILWGLVYANNDNKRFLAINVKPKESISKNYLQLQTLYEQITADDLNMYYATINKQNFWTNLTESEKNSKLLFDSIIQNQSNNKEVNKLIETLIKTNPNSYINEFINRLKTK